MLETQKKNIGGYEYEVTPFPARRAIGIATRIAKAVGGGIGSIKNGGLLDQDVGALAGAILTGLDPAETPKLIFDLFASTHRDRVDLSKEVNFDNAFTGNYEELAQAMAFILQVNFGGFMGALAQVTGSQPGAVKANPPISQAS